MNKPHGWHLLAAAVSVLAVLAGCPAGPVSDEQEPLTQEELDALYADARTVESIELAVYSYLGAAMVTPPAEVQEDWNPDLDPPEERDVQTAGGERSSGSRGYEGAWIGPDSGGWYRRTSTYEWYGTTLTLTEQLKAEGDESFEYKSSLAMSSAEGSWRHEVEEKWSRGQNGLFSGYHQFRLVESGYQNSADVKYRYEFAQYDPGTGAGVFDWFAGGWDDSSLGNNYHRFLHLQATYIGNDTMRISGFWQDDSGWTEQFGPYTVPCCPAGRQP